MSLVLAEVHVECYTTAAFCQQTGLYMRKMDSGAPDQRMDVLSMACTKLRRELSKPNSSTLMLRISTDTREIKVKCRRKGSSPRRKCFGSRSMMGGVVVKKPR